MDDLNGHDRIQALQAHEVSDCHQSRDEYSFPEGAEVASDDSRKDRQGGAAFTRGCHNLIDMLGMGTGEDFREFRDQNGRERAATDDGCQLPPKVTGSVQIANEQPTHEIRGRDTQK